VWYRLRERSQRAEEAGASLLASTLEGGQP